MFNFLRVAGSYLASCLASWARAVRLDNATTVTFALLCLMKTRQPLADTARPLLSNNDIVFHPRQRAHGTARHRSSPGEQGDVRLRQDSGVEGPGQGFSSGAAGEGGGVFMLKY